MLTKEITQTIDFGDGRIIELSTGKLAKQAHGSVVLRTGETVLLATVVSNHEPAKDIDYFPLSVDYREKFSAAGRFPGGFIKRENRPSDYEVLISRLVDRALRPLFPDDYHSETQVLIQLHSCDKETMPDALACLAASAALSVSDIPFNGPVAEVRVAKIGSNVVINPALSDLENATLDLIVAGNCKDIIMVEGEMKEESEAEMLNAIKKAHEAIKTLCQAQSELGSKAPLSYPKREYTHEENDDDLKKKVTEACYKKCYLLAQKGNPDKHQRADGFAKILSDFIATLPEEVAEENEKMIKRYFHETEKEAVRKIILDKKIRLDGRKTDEIRPIWSEVDVLPSTHGSAIFTRGETQSLSTVTLGTKLDQQSVDGAFMQGSERFMLHYNFPPFSIGEARFLRATSRREIGHGHLAQRALKVVLPDEDKNPYTIRIVSEILESNGSSSMATVCAGSLALMDAGIQISKPVTGIAMGLITDKDGNYAILSDILGDEDHLGDMDFKVTGTKDGITACQMDIKVDGLSYSVLEEALEQARKGRLHILGEISKTLDAPRKELKPHAPGIVQLKIPRDTIGAVIGPGGKVIQEIQRETESTIVIEEVDDMGVVDIMSGDKEGLSKAVARIKALTAQPEVNEIYTGKVKSIVPFGAFVEIMPGKEGLLHISELEWRRVEDVSKILKEGDEVQVKLLEVDQKTGKLRLSRKALLPKPESQKN